MKLPLLVLLALLAGCATPAITQQPPADDDDAAVPGATFAWMPLGTSGAEPSIGVTSSGAAFIISGDVVMRSRDLGASWEPVYEFGAVHPPVPPGLPVNASDPVRNSDPMLWVDPVTDRVFAPLMWPALACSMAIWSDDDGESWTEKPMSCGTPGVDHQRLATGAYVPGSPLPRTPASDYPNVVYYCYSKVATYSCAVSNDGGVTYVYEAVVDQLPQCGGAGGTPHAAPDGVVYVPLGGLNGCDTVSIGVSRDNGFSWTVERPDVGGLGQDEIDPDITVTPDGTAYYVFRSSKDHVAYMLRSTDGFATVDGPYRIAPTDVTSTNFIAITSGDDGRISISYLGSRDTKEHPGDAGDETRWHLFVATSTDASAAEPTFQTTQVTPDADPAQIGRIHYGGGTDPARNLLEFIDAATDPEGRVWVAWTDGCVDECANNPRATHEDSRARATSAAVQTDGPRLRLAP